MAMELVALSTEDASRAVCGYFSTPVRDSNLTTELLAAGLRRAASLMCPTTPVALIMAVDQSLEPLFPDENRRSRCRDMLEDLLALGDLMEYDQVTLDSEESAGQRRLVYAAPPYFVELSRARFLVLGIAPDTIDPLPGDLQLTIRGHVRSLSTQDPAGVRRALLHAGLHKVSYAAWARAPKIDTSEDVVSAINYLLDMEGPCSALESLRVLDGSIVSPWYKERWVNPRGLTGRFVSARPRKYGADLWCYVELDNGEPQRLVDLPLGHTLERGCDQAWRLQCALDAELGNPQTFEISDVDHGRIRMDIHIPSPNWLQRRWDCIGERASEGVFSYLFDATDRGSEIQILRDQLWMIPTESRSSL